MKVRVRKDSSRALLIVKGPRTVISRLGFVCEISVRQVDAMLGSVLDDGRIDKVRHSVPHGGLTWTVDVYQGAPDGIVVAEVVPDAEAQDVPPPDWIGREVTGDTRSGQSAIRDLEWKRA